MDAVTKIYTEPDPLKPTPEHTAIKPNQSKFGFTYHSLLEELMYTYVTYCPDIGYVVVALSKYAGYPQEIHYTFNYQDKLNQCVKFWVLLTMISIDINISSITIYQHNYLSIPLLQYI